MITKIKSLKNLAVFKEFKWDESVQDKQGRVIDFKKLNIFYGRNYSGKTSLSRLIDALDTGEISDKYEGLECILCFDDKTEVNQENFKNHSETIRVFNEDFIKRNLKFINHPEENALPFAIIGKDGVDIEGKIKELKKRLGKNKEEEKSGLYKDLETDKKLFLAKKSAYSSVRKNLEKLLRSKATGKDSGIKYQAKYNKVNYDIRDLKKDIIEIKKKDYVHLSEIETDKLNTSLNETTKDSIPEMNKIKLNFQKLSSKAELLVTSKVLKTDKIEELVKNAKLNEWVEKGIHFHKGKRDTCAFCNNEIKSDRWSELDKHFDEESEKLKNEISSLIEKVKKEEDLIKNYNQSLFAEEAIYSTYIDDYRGSLTKFNIVFKGYLNSLSDLKSILEERRNDIINEKSFKKPKDFSSEIQKAINELDIVREKSNNYTNKLTDKKNEAKEKLRLNEIYNFIIEIKYDNEREKLRKLEEEKDEADKEVNDIQNEISDIQQKMDNLQISLGENSIGAEKINQYLNNHFGNEFLKMEPIKVFDKETQNEISRFEIRRGGRRAYHLSEGEKSLLAFCYFIAKLEDIETKNKNPIIWIDDPISSLDSNHIFFMYSLIKSEIFNRKEFKQLFISTHNLNFLKYLKRLPSHKFQEKTNYFMIERFGEESVISEMPMYLQKNITEFNHLFKKIYECSIIDRVTDDNYTVFYDFGNNARKFFEIYLFYKYPDFTNDSDKLKRFFGEDDIPVILTDRINNEYSHLAAQFERGQQPVEVPEMKKVAELIIKKIKDNDNEQYDSLLKSLDL